MRTVLCVGDNLALGKLSTKIREAGYRCLTASGAVEAERQIVANDVDLVILNNGDPGIHGEALATHLKKIRYVKILMLTRRLAPRGLPKSVDLILVESSLPTALLDAVAFLTGRSHPAQRANGTC